MSHGDDALYFLGDEESTTIISSVIARLHVEPPPPAKNRDGTRKNFELAPVSFFYFFAPLPLIYIAPGWSFFGNILGCPNGTFAHKPTDGIPLWQQFSCVWLLPYLLVLVLVSVLRYTPGVF